MNPQWKTPDCSAPIPAALCPSAGRLKAQSSLKKIVNDCFIQKSPYNPLVNFTNICTGKDKTGMFTEKYTE